MTAGGLTLIKVDLAAKLASIVVHADEMTSPDGLELDAMALRRLIDDRDVVVWVNKMTEAGLAPVKRK